MTNTTLELKPLPALRVAQVSAVVDDTTEISRVVEPLFDTLVKRLSSAGISIVGHGIRTYYGRPDGTKIDVAAAVPVAADVAEIEGADIVELRAEARGASMVYRGPAADIADAWKALDVGVAKHGLTSHGLHREVLIEVTDDFAHCVAELQCPVRDDIDCPAP